MAALDGSELIEVIQGGRKITIAIRDLTRKLFRVQDEGGTSYTLKVRDIGSRLRMTSGSATSVIVSADADIAWEDWAAFEIEAAGAGQVTVVAAAGVTITTADTLKSNKRYALLYLVREAANQWHLSGYQEAA